MYIFIDESGDLGKGSKFFVIGMVFYYEKDLGNINKVINIHNRYLWSNGWPKDAEIKASNLYNYKNPAYKIDTTNLKINPKVYLQGIYKDINKLDIKAGFLIHEPCNQGPILKCLHKEKVYNFLSKSLYTECFSYLRDTMDIYIDQRSITLVKKQKNVDLGVHRLNLDYIGYIRNELSFQFCTKRRIDPIIDIAFEDSKRIKGLQVVDYLTWAIRKKYEGRSFWYDLVGRIEKIEKVDNF